MTQLLSATREVLPESVERIAYSVYWNAKYSMPISRRRARKDRLIVLVATAHKVGSTWLFHLLREIGQFERRLLPSRFMHLDTIEMDDPAVFSHLSRGSGYSIYKSHSFPPAYPIPSDVADDVRFVTIFRDPRDAIVSASFFVASLSRERGGWGEAFEAMNVPSRIKTLIGQGDFLLSRLESWFHSSTAHKVRYEALLDDPEREMGRLAKHLGLDCDPDHIAQVCNRHSFKARSGRNPGEEKPTAFLRKGISGDWKKHFDDECVAAFKEAYDGRWNKLLVEMEYESTPEW